MAAFTKSLKQYFDALDDCGYSRDLNNTRAQIMKNGGKSASLFYQKEANEDIDIFIVGSRGEGIGIDRDCDLDRLFVQRSVICIHTNKSECDQVRHSAEFKLDFENMPSGYCRLRLISQQEQANADAKNFRFLKNMKAALQQENGHIFLRNDKMLTSAMQHVNRNGWLVKSFVYDVAEGPSKPYVCNVPISGFSFRIDDVLGFECIYPSIVQDWCDRKREYDWPSSEVVEKAKSEKVLVVPVGESEDEVLQWRVSLVLAELILVRSFNDVQLKVFGALKMLSKNVLKKSCDNMSSYIIKNVVFWMSEKTQTNKFEERQFFDMVKQGLRFLRDCVDKRQLSCYMIPERNLLKGKLSDTERENVLKDIDACLKYGENVFLRCDEFKKFSDESDTWTKNIEFIKLTEEVLYCLFTFSETESAKYIEDVYGLKTKEDVISFFFGKHLSKN